MGTRNLTIVQIDNEYKVAQYGQWDGYPEGQGRTVLKFLTRPDLDLEKFKERVRSCKFITRAELRKRYDDLGIRNKDGSVSLQDADTFAREYPQLDRDMGAKVLDFIYDTPRDIELTNEIEFAEDSLMNEWSWLLNLDERKLECYKGFNSDPLQPGERFYREDFTPYKSATTEYHQIKKFMEITFDEIQMLGQDVALAKIIEFAYEKEEKDDGT